MNDGAMHYLFEETRFHAPLLGTLLLGVLFSLIMLSRYPRTAILTMVGAIILLIGSLWDMITEAILVSPGAWGDWLLEHSRTMALVGSGIQGLGVTLLLVAAFVGRRAAPERPT